MRTPMTFGGLLARKELAIEICRTYFNLDPRVHAWILFEMKGRNAVTAEKNYRNALSDCRNANQLPA